jgi:glycerol-3-phosphate dehydrogenase
VSAHGKLDIAEYLQMMSAVKSGIVSYSSFVEMAKREHQGQEKISKYGEKIERSGGGV